MAMTKAYEGLLPVDTQSTVLRGTARGLAHIHAFAIAHFDFSPGNILIHGLSDSGLVAKITDFGCSRRLRTPSTRHSDCSVAYFVVAGALVLS